MCDLTVVDAYPVNTIFCIHATSISGFRAPTFLFGLLGSLARAAGFCRVHDQVSLEEEFVAKAEGVVAVEYWSGFGMNLLAGL